MSWFRVDDGFTEHAKLDALERKHGPRALADCVLVWLAIGTWCSRQLAQGGALPDGVIDEVGLRRIRRAETDPVECAEMLREAGLLEKVRQGYAMHDWPEYQPTSEEVQTKRAANRERQKKFRETKLAADKRRVSNGVTTPTPSQRYTSTGNGVTSAKSQRYMRPSNAVSHTTPDPDPDPGVSLKGNTPGLVASAHPDPLGRGTPREAGAPPLKLDVILIASGYPGCITPEQWAADQALPHEQQLYMKPVRR